MATNEVGEMSFAERMMKSMGWSEGKGLGKQEEGMKDFIKPKMKFNNKGIGFMGVDNKWIAHQEHFDDLLTSLNKGEKPAQQKDIACLTSASKLRGRTKFYAKMMRGKDLSNRSSRDLSAIIVPLSKKEEVEKPETAPLPSELDDTLKPSQVSMSEYFTKMMAQRRSKLNTKKDSTSEISRQHCDNGDDNGLEKSAQNLKAEERQKTSKKRKKAMRDDEESTTPLGNRETEHGDFVGRRKRRELDMASYNNSAAPPVESETEPESMPQKKKKRKSERSAHGGDDDFDDAKREKKAKKSRKIHSQDQVLAEAATNDPHKDNAPEMKKKHKKTKKKKDTKKTKKNSKTEENREAAEGGENHISAGGLIGDETPTMKPRINGKRSEPKLTRGGAEFEIAENGTRLNVDVELLKEIRGSKLARSKATPARELTDEQIQEIYRLWTSGEYAEFMRRVHAGQLPRWVAVEKSQVERMISGRTKLIDLADIRDVLQTKWDTTNVDEIWGYTNLADLAV